MSSHLNLRPSRPSTSYAASRPSASSRVSSPPTMAPTSRRQPSALTPLPTYQAPHLPLSATEINKLTALTNPRSQLAKLSETIGSTINTLGNSAYELFPDHEKSSEEKDKLMDEMEEMARLLVDANTHSVDMRSALEDVVNGARAVGRREVEPTLVGEKDGLVGQYDDLYRRKKAEWDGLTDKDRYTNSPEYLDFRRAHWESRNPDAPLPHSRTWFPNGSNGGGGEEEEENSDLEIAQERQSYNCPLTLRPFQHPVRSSNCPHVFEKSAIMDMIFRSKVGGVPCPTPGCRKMLTANTLKEDPGLLRKALREREREKRRKDREGSGDEGDGDDDGMDIDAYAKEKAAKKVKAEKTQARRRSSRKGKTQAMESDDEGAMDEDDD